MVCVDFWNFQLSINELVNEFKVDWRQMGHVIAQNPCVSLMQKR